MANILLTGATGAIGRFVTRTLLAEGHQLRLLVRTAKHAPTPSPHLTLHQGDLSRPDTLKNAAAGVDTVIHLAAKLHINNPSAELFEQYRQINVGGTQALVDDALRHGVERFVFASTIKVYGSNDGASPFTEASPLNPDSIYAETKLSAENVVRDQIPHVILRLAAVYGRQMNGNYPRLVRAIGKRRFAYIGDGTNRRALIHEHDVARALSLIATSTAALNETFNLSDGQPHTLRQIVEAIATAQNVRPPAIFLPARPLRAALGLVEDATALIKLKTPIVRAIVDKVTEDIAVSSDKLTQTCQFVPQVGLEQGWRDVCMHLGEGL